MTKVVSYVLLAITLMILSRFGALTSRAATIDDSVGQVMDDGSIVAVDSDFLCLEIKPTSLPSEANAGLGVFAKVDIKSNEILCEYRGAIIPKEVEYNSDYIYSSRTASHKEISIIPEGNKPICAFINDCAVVSQNTYTVEEIDRIESKQLPLPLHEGFTYNSAALITKMGKIFVVSTKNISTGSELFYPYGAPYWIKKLRSV